MCSAFEGCFYSVSSYACTTVHTYKAAGVKMVSLLDFVADFNSFNAWVFGFVWLCPSGF